MHDLVRGAESAASAGSVVVLGLDGHHCYSLCGRGVYEMRLASCARDFTSSFLKAFWR